MNNKLNLFTLNQSKSVKDALEIINSSPMQFALIVDDDGGLIGTVTDGDVRRFLLDGHKISSDAVLAMNPSPISGTANQSIEELNNLMLHHDITAIPILDLNSKVIDIEIADKRKLSQKKIYDNPVFLMAGGLGTRLQPLTNESPKPMLQVGGKPLLEIILKNFIDHGFVNFYISVQYLPEMIIDHFKDGKNFGVSIQYIHEDQPLGTAGALGLLPKKILDSPIIVMNGDILTSVDFPALLAYHNKHNGSATMCVRDYEFQVPLGVIEGSGSRINLIKEKPIHKCQVNAGIYVINPDIIKTIPKNKRVDMPDFLSDQIAQDNSVHMFPIHEYWLDIGRLEDFHKAQIDYPQS
jgi:dTDP-glucose pyrophosphorylase/predicted transcriptional regulator